MFAGAFAKCWRVPLLPRNGEMRRISIKLCRFPGSRDKSRIRDNVFRFQRCLSEPLVTAFGCSKIKKRSMDGNLARLDRRKHKQFFLAERSNQWFRQTAFKPGCIVTHRGVVSTSREGHGITDYTFLHFSISWQQRHSPAFRKRSSEHLPHLNPYERIKTLV